MLCTLDISPKIHKILLNTVRLQNFMYVFCRYIILALVTFSTDNYTALVNETSVEIRVIAIGPLDIEFRVQVVPDGTDLPEGGMYIAMQMLTAIIVQFFSTVNQFFNPDIIEVFFPINVSIALLQIQLSPEQVGDMDLQFTVRLVVPAAAMSQGVVLGEPSLSTVTVPTPQ